MAMPMVSVRDRGARAPLQVRSVQRPRALSCTSGAPPVPAPAAVILAQSAAAPPAADKLRIKLPRRPRVSSSHRTAAAAAVIAPAMHTPSRERTRSGNGSGNGENGDSHFLLYL